MNKIQVILLRFLKGAVAAAVVSMGMVTIKQPAIWTDFIPLLQSLGIAGVYGGLVGLLLGLQKWASWTEKPPIE